MKRILFAVVFPCIVSLCLGAGISVAGEKTKPPRFEDYPVREKYDGKNAPPGLQSPEEREFRTMLREAAQNPPDFAGHFIVGAWGCGAGCVSSAIIDAKSGAVYMVPFTASVTGDRPGEPIEYKADSSLFVVHGSRNEADENGDFYYQWDGKTLKLIDSKVIK